MKKFPHHKQSESKDCGPTCLKSIAAYYGRSLDIQTVRNFSETTREGTSLLFLSDAAEKLGFRTIGIKVSLHTLEQAPLPCILHWNKDHFVILYAIKQRRTLFGKSSRIFKVSDPAHGLLEYGQDEFLSFWINKDADENTEEGIALLLEPTPKFFDEEFNENNKSFFGFGFLFNYLIKYKAFLIQLVIGLIAANLLQLIFPFLTQSVVDVGLRNQNIHFVYMVLLAQLFLFFARTGLEIIRSWTILHLSRRINISLISDFFIKLMNLPIAYFDVRITGDAIQRINDHERIERILTTSSLNVLFSVFNTIIMGAVLAYYNLTIFVVFFIGSLLYFLWASLFLKRRKALDYKRFSASSREQSKVFELISGMQEIKLHNAETSKRWEWENIQATLFKVSLKSLALEQTQMIGSNFINELKNIIIIFLSAKLVIDGEITLGMMMAISSIVGSLNAPVTQLIGFMREVQDAKISLSRLSEIHDKEDETLNDDQKIHDIISNSDIILRDVSFRYVGSDTEVLKKINAVIPANKVTAIVGSSGSGKTTLIKMLLNFYEPIAGEIQYGKISLKNIAQKTWRNHIGSVMQEGYIFNDTISGNIAIGNKINMQQLRYAAEVANIAEFIEELPLGYNTITGSEGMGMSTGQKQRLLIARSVYKNPEMLFLDEATSALDAKNEKQIVQKLDEFFKNKTVVIVAHRLSTVINADQIIVLEKGEIVEKGTHNDLVDMKGTYYELVRNQLELGK